LPSYLLSATQLFHLPIEVSDSPVLRCPQEVLDGIQNNPESAIAVITRSLDEAVHLSTLFEAAIEKWNFPVQVMIVEPQTDHHSHWVICLSTATAQQIEDWFLHPVDTTLAH
jgi:hypothetical protein